jgi:hypothetical protein
LSIGACFLKSVCTAQLVDRVARTPSSRTTARALGMSSVQLEHLWPLCKDWLSEVCDAWADKTQIELPAVAFPSALGVEVTEACLEWSTRTQAQLLTVQQSVLVARALLAVSKYELRGVHVLCVLPPTSPLRQEDSARHSHSLDFQRKELVLRLMPLNASLATTFAKQLGMDLLAVRNSAAAILTGQ